MFSINSSWVVCPSYSQFHNLKMFSVVPSGREVLLPFTRMWLNTGENLVRRELKGKEGERNKRRERKEKGEESGEGG